MYEDVMVEDEPAFDMLPFPPVPTFPPVPKPATRGGPLRVSFATACQAAAPSEALQRGTAAGRLRPPSCGKGDARSNPRKGEEGFEAQDDLRDLPRSLVAPNVTVWSDTKTPK